MQHRASTIAALVIASCVLLAFACKPQHARAEVSLGPHFGYNFDWDDPLLGAELRADVAVLSSTVLLQVDPSLSLGFLGGGTLALDLSFNMPFQFMIRDSVLRPFVAPGLAFVHYSGDWGSNSDLFLNLIGGLLFDLGHVDPFIQMKIMIPHNAMVELVGGVLFTL